MSKKHHQTKKPESNLIARYLSSGNFWAARKEAHLMLAHADLSPADRASAQFALRMTWPDSIALLVGFLCLAFSVGIAFLAAY